MTAAVGQIFCYRSTSVASTASPDLVELAKLSRETITHDGINPDSYFQGNVSTVENTVRVDDVLISGYF